MRILLVLLSLIGLSIIIFGQKAKDRASGQNSSNRSSFGTRIGELSLASPEFKPKVSLQEALKHAESFIEKEKIDTSSYYLLEARMIQYGGEKDVKELRWFFRWAHENGAVGNYIEISVSMDGKIERHPSM